VFSSFVGLVLFAYCYVGPVFYCGRVSRVFSSLETLPTFWVGLVGLPRSAKLGQVGNSVGVFH
jgi:hypothetical protein